MGGRRKGKDGEKRWVQPSVPGAVAAVPRQIVKHVKDHNRFTQIMQQYPEGCDHSDTNLLYLLA